MNRWRWQGAWALAFLPAVLGVKAAPGDRPDDGRSPMQTAQAEKSVNASAPAKRRHFRDSDEGKAALAAAKSTPAAETYASLLPLESRYAGDVDYDYLLGTAALDAGKDSAAVFALQRAGRGRAGLRRCAAGTRARVLCNRRQRIRAPRIPDLEEPEPTTGRGANHHAVPSMPLIDAQPAMNRATPR